MSEWTCGPLPLLKDWQPQIVTSCADGSYAIPMTWDPDFVRAFNRAFAPVQMLKHIRQQLTRRKRAREWRG